MGNFNKLAMLYRITYIYNTIRTTHSCFFENMLLR